MQVVNVTMNTENFFSLQNPLHTLPAPSQVSVANLHLFSELVSGLGGNPRKIMEENGFDSSVERNVGSYIDCKSFVNLYEQCAIELKQPLFGLRLAQLQNPDTYGFVTALCRAAPNFRVAIECLIDFIPVVHSTESVLELMEGSETAEFRWSEVSNMGVNKQTTFQGLLLNLKVLKMLGNQHFSPSYVNLPAGVFKQTLPELEQALGCPVRTTAGKGCIAFSVTSLDLPVSSANQPLYQLLHGYLSTLQRSATPGFLDSVSTHIRRALNAGDVSLESCALHLGVCPRTLQLRLKRKGLSYSELLDQHRLERATVALKNTDFSVAEVADSLGYAERTSFGRAFKRWTGLSPQQYRNQQVLKSHSH